MQETATRLLNPDEKQDLQRDFKGVWIPKEVWLDKNLNALDKIILVEINSLDTEKGCYASNKYLAEFCQCSEQKIVLSISKLKKLGYIEQISFDGRIRILRSRLLKFSRQTTKKCEADSENLVGYNNNNIVNNIENNKEIYIAEKPKKQAFTKPTIEEIKTYAREMNLSIDCEYFFDYYESNGWKVSNTPMKDWKATLRNWARREKKYDSNRNKTNGTTKGKYADFVGETFEV